MGRLGQSCFVGETLRPRPRNDLAKMALQGRSNRVWSINVGTKICVRACKLHNLAHGTSSSRRTKITGKRNTLAAIYGSRTFRGDSSCKVSTILVNTMLLTDRTKCKAVLKITPGNYRRRNSRSLKPLKPLKAAVGRR